MTNVEQVLQETEDVIAQLGWDPNGIEARTLRDATAETVAYKAAVFADAVEDLIQAWIDLPAQAKRIAMALAKGTWR